MLRIQVTIMMLTVSRTATSSSGGLFYRWVPVVLLLLPLLPACEQAPPEAQGDSFSVPGPASVARNLDAKQVAEGAVLYREHCAACHGHEAEGTENWRRTGADGKYPPPPLNGTAHAWHHPTEVLLEVIMDGSIGDGNMPAWRGKLSQQQALAIIAWFQSLWSDEVYAIWHEIDARARDDSQ